MADLFHKQAENYAVTRPSYPHELFQFIASKTQDKDLIWDVGTGSGQAAKHLAGIYKKVIATDTSQKQLNHAPKLPNIHYQVTSATMTMSELETHVAGQSTVDLVTIAQALHWFDLPTFYQQVKYVLKKPHGVIAAWCYTLPEVDESVDSVLFTFYANSKPYWDPARKLVEDKYSGIEFPFDPVDGVNHTGPFEFKTEQLMDLEGLLMYIRSWSAYQTAKEKGVEMLGDEVVEKFKKAWGNHDKHVKVVKYPVHLRIGKVGNLI